jgi:PAS domain S-box-containing protein
VPFLFWLDIVALSMVTVLAAALTLVVLGNGLRRALNRIFACFTLLAAVWGLFSLLCRLALWLKLGQPLLYIELASLAFCALGPLLLPFTVRFLSLKTRAADLTALAIIAVLALLAQPLFRHRILSAPAINPNGSTTLVVSPAGLAIAALPAACFAWALFLYRPTRARRREPALFLGVAALLAGFILDGVIELPLPLLSLAVLAGIAVLGYAIVHRQIFNPLREVTAVLEQRVEERTAELNRAYRQVERRVEERTAELDREVEERKRAERVLAARAARLELVAGVGRRTTAILDLDELLHQAVGLIRDTFGYYSVNIMLVEGEMVVLRAATHPALHRLEGGVRLRLGEEGITGWVAGRGEPLLVPDVSRDERYATVLEDVETRAELAVPIRFKEEVIGVLDAQSAEWNAFSQDDLFTLQTVADQLAVAMDNARLYEETRRRAVRLAVVNRIAEAVGATLQLDDLLEKVYREVTPVFAADAFFVSLYDEAEHMLDFRLQVDQGLREAPARSAPGNGLTARVIKEKKPLRINNLPEERPRLPEPEVWGSMKLPDSWLGAPMLIGERLIGVICVQAYHRDAYSEEDELLLSTIADQVAVAVESARLYEAAEAELIVRRRTEEELKESEEKLQGIGEHSPNMIFINCQGRVVYANRICEEVMGYSREEFYAPGFDFMRLIAPESQDMIKANFGRHLAGEELPPYEYSLITKGGKKLEVIISTKLVTYGGERALLGIITDISARKWSETLLETLNAAALAIERALLPEEIFARVGERFSALGFSCLVYRRDSAQGRLIPVYQSRASESTAGGGPPGFADTLAAAELFREVVEQRVTRFVAGPDLIGLSHPPGSPESAAERLGVLDADGVIAAPLIGADEVIGLLVVHAASLSADIIPAVNAFAHQIAAAWRKALLMQDLERSLEELKRTQEQLLQAQKMEAVGKLAGGVAHDFNNLLTAITGYADLLLGSVRAGDAYRSDLEEIKSAAARAAALTRQLLAFSRKQVLQPLVLDLNKVVGDLENMLQRLLGEDIVLEIRLQAGPALVRADPGQVEQVIMNLAVNARDAMPRGGRLSIATSCVEPVELPDLQPEAGPPQPWVLLTVSDSGVGMSAEIKSQVFEPFFTTKEQGKGTGLGLSTVYGIVTQSGGQIRVDSEPGRGAVFRIYLPRVAEPAAAQRVLRRPPRRRKGSETILLVEDEGVVRELARKVLERNGYTVLAAGHAEEALRISREHDSAIQLLITDVIMPGGMGGRELADRLSASLAELRVLFMSGYTADAVVHQGVQDREVEFLQKPFTPAGLLEKVRAVLDRRERD